MAFRKPLPLQEGPGWTPLLQSDDFGQWEEVLACTLGHHRSRLQRGSVPFEATMVCGSVDEFQVLWLQGRGALELQREQCGDGVLWLPLQGLIQETINGEEHLAEPGTALLFRPGDVMTGLTAERVCGVSIVVPQHYLQGDSCGTPLLRQGQLAQRLIQAGWELVEAAAMNQAGASFAAERLVDAFHQMGNPAIADHHHERITTVRRRALVADACSWMQERLGQRMSVVEMSTAMNVSVRTVQNSFQSELGCSPMAELKRMRLQELRRLLLNPERRDDSVAALMNEAGLLACGVTAADYQQWCGELPRKTRKGRSS